MFWDGSRWVGESDLRQAAAAATPTRRRRFIRRPPFLVTALAVLIALPAFVVGVASTPIDPGLAASGPTVTITGIGVPPWQPGAPGRAGRGWLVIIDGRGFKPHSVYQVHLDGGGKALRLVWPGASGRFHGYLQMPATATTGVHDLTFSPVDPARAARVARGALSMSALAQSPAVAHATVRVRRHSGGSAGTRPVGPTISQVRAASVTQSNATVSWSLDEPGTGQVEFGPTAAYGQVTTPELSYTYSAHIQQLSGLTPGTLYHFRVKSADAAGALSVSADSTFATLGGTTDPTAPPPGDPTAPPTSAPTAPPTSAPTAPPTSAPTAPPTPSPVPTTAPAGTLVPASIDATGASDVSAALMSFIASVPNGSTIVFKAGGTYRVNVALKISGKTNVTFNGNGATIKAVGTGYNENYSLFYFVSYGGGNSGIQVRNFKLVGSDPTPGTFTGGQEGQHGILVDGGTNFEIDHNTFSAAFGDGVEVNSGASYVHIHDNVFTSTGRNGLSVIWGNHVEFDHNTLGTMGYMPFDVEPNTASQPSSFISIHDNATGYWSNAFFAVDGSQTGAAIHDISVVNNTSTGKSLLTVVTGPGRKQTIVMTGNRSTVSASGPVLSFKGVDGLTVTGNSQPLSSGALVSTTSCTGVTAQ